MGGGDGQPLYKGVVCSGGRYGVHNLQLSVEPYGGLHDLFSTLLIMSHIYQGLDRRYQLPLQVEQGEEEVY